MDLLLDGCEITDKIMDRSDFKWGSFEVLFKDRATGLLMEDGDTLQHSHLQFREAFARRFGQIGQLIRCLLAC